MGHLRMLSSRALGAMILALCSPGATSTHYKWSATPWTRGTAAATSALPPELQVAGGAVLGRSRASSSMSPHEDGEPAGAATDREKLYEAYNLLHALGKDFKVPITAPSVLVVGHQSAGKSALVEALMGFQFNNVGGGTKTRRPVALHMRYNPACSSPVCYLTNDVTGQEQRMTLDEVQEYITSENRRLEADPTRCFDHREIVVRVEYRHCPNMVMVDTPGLIATGKAHGKKEGRGADGRPLSAAERAHQQAAREAENLVLTKMRSPEYIILCIEDTSDWKHATCRSLVEQADPHLSRTVLVNTKLDAKLLQFTEGSDVEDFIAAPLVRQLHPHLSGGPFYTSVPSGRVGGRSTDAFKSQDAFIARLRRQEREDGATVAAKCGATAAAALEGQVGVRRLRRFLEQRVEKAYRANVASIVPVLSGALKRTEEAQARSRAELASLSTDSLKQAANQYREHFSKAVADCIQGTINAPVDYFGETLDEEQLGGGSFFNAASHSQGPGAIGEEVWARLVETEVGHAGAKLYGGSQYHRALREFALSVQHMALPDVTPDEIANAAGVNDVHDGTNYMRAACVIAVAKAQTSFEPLIEALQVRARHVMRRLFPIAMHMLDAKGVSLDSHMQGQGRTAAPPVGAAGAASAAESAAASAAHEALTGAVQGIFNDFVESALAECLARCEDDLRGMTRFVTWDLHERGSLAVQDSLPSKEMVNIYALTMKKKRSPAASSEYALHGEFDEQQQEQEQPERSRRRGRGQKRGQQRGGRIRGAQSAATAPRGSGPSVEEEWAAASGVDLGGLDNDQGQVGGDLERYGAEFGFDAAEALADQRLSGRQVTYQNNLGSSARALGAGGALGLSTRVERSDAMEVMSLMEQVACMRDGHRTTKVVSALVQQIVRAWRMSFAQNVAMKFNCFFLMPFLEEFPFYLRSRLDALYDGDLKHLFDLTEARANLERRLVELEGEREANAALQAKFEAVNAQLGHAAASARATGNKAMDDDHPVLGAMGGEGTEGTRGAAARRFDEDITGSGVNTKDVKKAGSSLESDYYSDEDDVEVAPAKAKAAVAVEDEADEGEWWAGGDEDE